MKKNNQKFLLLLLTVILIVGTAACGSSSKPNEVSSTVHTLEPQTPAAAPAAPPVPSMGMPSKAMDAVAESGGIRNNTQHDTAIPSDRKMVQYRALSIETKEFDDALKAIFGIIEESGGYIENQNVSGVSLFDRGGYNERRASITARIPADRLAQVVNTMGNTGNVVSTSSNIDDITDTYFDTQARLDSLTLQEERLLVILEKAEKLEDVITLEKALSDVRYQIESLTAAVRRMDSQVSFSYLNISLMEVVEYKVVENLPKSFGERMAIAWSRSTAKIVDWGQNIILYAIEDGPLFLINLTVFLVIIVLLRPVVLRFIKKQKKARSEAPNGAKADPNASKKDEK